MRTTKLTRFARSKWSRVVCVIVLGVVVLFIAVMPSAQTGDPVIKVMKVGLGSGTITSTDGLINCGGDCDENYTSTTTVNLRAVSDPLDPFSRFSRWLGDCTGIDPMVCTVTVSSAHWVKAEFTLTTATSTAPVPPMTDLTPDGPTGAAGIRRYLIDHPEVTTPARFIAALPPEYRQNWILMSRSESLQTGTAESPRILLPSANGERVFTIGMTLSSSYPGAHPNAIEYMQWDPAQKNFRFHEIVLNPIGAMGETLRLPDGSTPRVFPARPRDISIDDAKCPKCHSTRNVLNLDRTASPPARGPLPGTDIVPPGTAVPATTVMAKNKPNWDTYDSWGGMLPFNRDRIFNGSLEAAAFRNIFNLWNWRTNDAIRSVIEQLQLQPVGVPAVDEIGRVAGGPDDGHISFFFDRGATITTEPTPSGSPPFSVNYSFDRILGTGTGTGITRGGESALLQHSTTPGSTGEFAEGRGVQLFDLLGGFDGSLNSQRIADELSTHRYAPGSVRIDVRPIALAIAKNCFSRSGDDVTSSFRTPALDANLLDFFRARNGNLTLSQFFDDTRARAKTIPRRKADIEKLNLDRTQFDGSLDPYLATRPVPTPTPKGLLQQFGGSTTVTTTGIDRARREVFRRPPNPPVGFREDTVIGGFYVDREDYANGPFNTEKMTLYRYFLEPLGVSVDKWSMGVRGRSRTYSFADIFDDAITVDALRNGLEASLTADRFGSLGAPFACGDLMNAVNDIARPLPRDGGGPLPTYTDVQRIFNKSCIECHGGLFYPPYGNLVFPTGPGGSFTELDHFDLSEEEYPTMSSRRRMERSHANAVRHIGATDETAELFRRINGTSTSSENCPGLFMPCGGPWLNQADVNLILRWIRGGHAYSEGDPHLKTIDGLNYDFQSAGEFVLLRGENLEIQTRQIPIDTTTPLGPNEHTGLSSCVSLNGAVAVRIDGHRITYQPNISGEVDPSSLQLRIDGKLTQLAPEGVPVTSGVRVMQTTAPGGIRIEAPGGTAVIITPRFWDYWQVWHMDVNVIRGRATEGLMGTVPPGSWLPALPDGTSLGPKPADLSQRYVDLYERFEAAWRVTDATTLFDYGSGKSTRSFTIESWPIQNPRNCQVPRLNEGGPEPKAPLQALPETAAQQACAGIVAADRKANCIKDVMVTGDSQFATTYLLTDGIERNVSPSVPTLTSPQDYYDSNKTDLAGPVTFTWNTAADPDGDVVTYRHCVWVFGQIPDNNKCVLTSVQGTARRKAAFWITLLVLIICLLLLLFLLLVRRQRPPVLLVLLAIVILVSAILAIYLRRTTPGAGTVAKTIAELQPGKDYSWKVIAEDGKGGISESETRRFKMR